jgi:hypothetical protein
MSNPKSRKQEKGIALLFVLLAIMLLSAIAVGMLYTASIETTVSANFKTQEKAYFAARGGIEELRERVLLSDAFSISKPTALGGLGMYVQQGTDSFGNPIYKLNMVLPGHPALPNGPQGVIYILNGVTMADVTTPPGPGAPNPYYDDELCHDYRAQGIMVAVPANVPCASLPAGTYYTAVNSIFQNTTATTNPFGATSAATAANTALEYKWVRLTWKENDSDDGIGGGLGVGNNWVDTSAGMTGAEKVCWNGNAEVVMPGSYIPTGGGAPIPITQCDQVPQAGFGTILNQNGTVCANCPSGPYGAVYLVTALAVTSNVRNIAGVRRLVQMEIAQTPIPATGYGAFATGAGCAQLKLAGGATTGSFSSAGELAGGGIATNPPSNLDPPLGTSQSTSGNQQGNVGSNGNTAVSGSSTNINGSIGSTSGTQGTCSSGSVTGTTVSGGANLNPGTGQQPVTVIANQTFPIPPAPNPMPPTTSFPSKTQTFATCGSNTCMTAGSYGNVSIQNQTVHLGTAGSTTPTIYVFNSLNIGANGVLAIDGPVIIEFGGNVTNGSVISMASSASFANSSYIPGNLILQYGGPTPCTPTASCKPSPQTGSNISLTGGTGAYAVVDAPLANVSFSGGSTFFGQVVANSIDDTGGVSLYYDTGLGPAPSLSAPYNLISLRELAY